MFTFTTLFLVIEQKRHLRVNLSCHNQKSRNGVEDHFSGRAVATFRYRAVVVNTFSGLNDRRIKSTVRNELFMVIKPTYVLQFGNQCSRQIRAYARNGAEQLVEVSCTRQCYQTLFQTVNLYLLIQQIESGFGQTGGHYTVLWC